jgi:hypothetical protein
MIASLAADIAQGVVVAIVVGALGWGAKRLLTPRIRLYLRTRRARRAAPIQLEFALAYLTHLRDGVMPAVWRTNTRPGEVREHIRRHILEPIRGYVATLPGEHIKVVWFRPTDDGQALRMHEQVGHTPEGQAAMRLPIGSGIAGKAFANEETIYCPDCSTDDRFQAVPEGHRNGSIVCVPIKRAGETTGVLSVWSTWKDAFWLTDRLYFEALAAAIGSLEVFEEPATVSTGEVRM